MACKECARWKALNELRLVRAGPEEGGKGFVITLRDPSGALGMLAASLAKDLDKRGAKNYVEYGFQLKNGKRLLVTVQRAEGKSPHALRIEAERERDNLKEKLHHVERVNATLRGARDSVTGPWWVSFEQMLTEEQRGRIGLSEDRGAVLCITRLCDALNDAEERLRPAPRIPGIGGQERGE